MTSRARVAGVFCFLVLAAISSSSPSHHARADQDCYEEKEDAMYSCWKYIRNGSRQPINPGRNEKCCKVVKKADVECICKKFSTEDLAKISLINWVAVTIRCDNALPKGFDCAGYKVPMQLPNA